jgi:hypothetical protein
VSELFDDTEPEDEPLAEALDDLDQAEVFRVYVREGIDDLQDWLHEQPGA